MAVALTASGGPERLVWTTGSWILHTALARGSTGQQQALAEGVATGAIAWHALPVTTHTLMDAAPSSPRFGISQELDQRSGRTTTAAKDRRPGPHPGAGAAAEAGVTFLHPG